MGNILIRSFVTWCSFVPIAITNGIVREKVYVSLVGNLAAHQISTASASLLFLLLTYKLMGSKLLHISYVKAFFIGLLWVIMTVLFEFGFGHYVDGASWEKLLADYNIFTGHVWGIFLLVVLLSPLIIKWLKHVR